jgi:hypothetical protein
VLVQNYYIRTDAGGREVIKRREADTEGLPPARMRITSPYDTDARWAAKGDDLYWNGYKVHLTETCHDPDEASQTDPPTPNLITNVQTTASTVPDVNATTPIHQALHERGLTPGEHYLDSGYPSAQTITTALASYGITLVTPALLDYSAQARAGTGFDKAAFTIDWDARQATCPQGNTSASWSPTRQRGTDVIVVKFGAHACDPCPARAQCTTAKRSRRQLTLHPHQLHQALARARAEQTTTTWQDKYALRAGVEGTIHQAITVTGIRHARYRGQPKVHLQQVFSAIALNLIRLHAWWTGHPLDRSRTSHLTHLDLAYDTRRFIRVLDGLGHQLGHQPVTVLWDNLGAHHAGVLEDWAATQPWLEVEYLPSYASELNPVEGLWANLKGCQLANRCCADRAELIATAQVGSIRARRDPELLRSFLAGTPLNL